MSVYVLGDSISVGMESYLPTDLSKAGYTGVTVNGVVGRPLTTGISILQTAPQALKDASSVVIELGTNPSTYPADNGTEFASQVAAAVAAVRAVNSTAQIYWVNLFAGASGSQVAAYNAALAANSDITVINAHGAGIPTGQDLGFNGHPTPTGYVQLAGLIAKRLGTNRAPAKPSDTFKPKKPVKPGSPQPTFRRQPPPPSVKLNPVPETGVKVTFSHALLSSTVGDLHVYVNPQSVTWAYGLNTQSYPTYGGEVVQILSVFFDDMTIQGQVVTYAEMERIYSWFLAYMQVATQGIDHPQYNQQPVIFNYWDRNWVFEIWPKALPGFRYGRDVVVPTWQLTAAVKEPETNFSGAVVSSLSDQIMSVSSFNAQYKDQLTTFGVATGDFGTTADLQNNPFAASDAHLGKNKNMASYISQESKKLADEYVGFLQSWRNNDLTSLPEFENISLPTQSGPNGPSSGVSSKKGRKTK